MVNYIEIVGITPISSFPNFCKCCPSNQICETDKLSIPRQKPSIESFIQVLVHLTVCSHDVICTSIGKKLVIEGIKHIKVLYVGDEPSQPVHSAHFEVPFCMFVLLKDYRLKVADVFIAVEDIRVQEINCRNFTISTLIFACPIFKPCKNNSCSKNHYHNQCDCNECNCNDYNCSKFDCDCKRHQHHNCKYCQYCDCKDHQHYDCKYYQHCDCKDHQHYDCKYHQYYDCKDYQHNDCKYYQCYDCKDYQHYNCNCSKRQHSDYNCTDHRYHECDSDKKYWYSSSRFTKTSCSHDNDNDIVWD